MVYTIVTKEREVKFMAKKTRKVLREELRQDYVANVSDFFAKLGEDVLRTGSNEIAFPTTDADGNEEFIVVTVKVPTGSRDGDIYDGYSMAEDYQMKLKEKKEKEEKKKIEKKKKIEFDKRRREKLKKMKEEREERE